MYTVLIVEDEILVSAGLRNMIRWNDMDMTIVGEARNGRQGLEMYHQMKPDIILTDIKMPVMDGLKMIEQIRQEDHTTKIIVLTCYKDFEMVRQAFKLGVSDYILKLKMTPEEMEDVVRKVHKELLCDTQTVMASGEEGAAEAVMQEEVARLKMRDYILYRSCHFEEFKQRAESLHLPENGIALCLMELIPSSDEPQSMNRRVEERVKLLVMNLIRDILAKCGRGEVVEENGQKYLLIFSFPDVKIVRERERLIQEILSRIEASIGSYINMESRFGISSFADSYQEMHRLYKEAAEAHTDAGFLGESRVFYGEEERKNRYRKIWDDFEERAARLEGLMGDYRERIMKEIAFLKQNTQENPQDSVREMLSRWIHWVSLGDNAHNKEKFMKEKVESALEAAEQIRGMDSLLDMLGVFESYLLAMHQDSKEARMMRKEVAETVDYIRAHYCESDISVSTAAEVVGMNKDYLSNIFKKETGVSFSDYVNIQRIRKAQELLSTTHLKSYQIAREIGFLDESYFSRIFKKTVGMRPNEYRKCERSSADFKTEERMQ